MDTLLHGFSVFLLIFCRMTAFFVVSPVFSSRAVPTTFKVGLAGILAFMVLFIIGPGQPVPGDLGYILYILREVLVGLLMGYVAFLIFSVIQMAGSFIDLQVGFGIANVLDPMTGATAPVLGNLKYVVAMLVFLSMNGHHYLLDAIIRSYDWVPLSNDVFQRIYNGNLADFLAQTFGQALLLAFQMSAPLVVAIFITDVALGLLARTAPQFNIFAVGIPVKIIVGLLVMLLLVPSFIYAFKALFEVLFDALHDLLSTIGQRPT
ncbi:flagellar biosynthetic protein FliR [Paenibacillus macerans]|uniref:flagellar biosynthetic protein FliR n=1 Tax=Paenibacillus macerans TaxID=44252 RepID=UPI002DBF6440|nr:flagellar biosynthetic protein FliR [Paenibacillus macerans]MEC0332980.1 flagellar biosynthetic protein FliR [Paenibacillus macerans]